MIVVVGEALVDLVPGGGDVLAAHLGGGPFNVARAVARLGGEVGFLGRLSEDRFGRALRAALQDDGVDLRLAVATEDPTTLAIAEVDAAGVARYVFYAAGTSVPGLMGVDVAAGAVAGASVLCVGSLGLVFEPVASTLEALVAAAPSGQLVACDPNCRPAAIGADAATYRARLERVLARTDLMKASEEDLAFLRAGLDVEAAARDLLAGQGVALVTLGGEGALVVSCDASRPSVPVAAPRVDVVDTIGAGDAFLGGFLSWWQARRLDRTDLTDAAALLAATQEACAVAARACTVAGASLPR
ncbi:Fructokinase [Baekduia alba]|uniref:carbohydrate kinase family protein n=1 Tax=Baekduia alba TaxID=2997333 RepID=UPI0023405A8A|nr:carbohydrate kinase [Baekduia alba]WCB94980.1 Fructokinase [Baekduia alba]